MTIVDVEPAIERSPNPGWQSELGERLALQQPWALHSTDLDPVVADFLDHHGDLVMMLLDVGHPTDPSVGAFMRAELRKYLLAITLLLERIDAIEFEAYGQSQI